MKLYVIRHGQTDYNAQRRFQGQANIPLNDVGRDQARRAGLVLSQLLLQTKELHASAVRVISSDLERTRQTTDIICTELSNTGKVLRTDIVMDERLREFHCGLFENSTYEEFVVNNPEVATDYMNRFDEDTYATKYPGAGGESRLDVMTRVGEVLKEVRSQSHIPLMIWVVHGGVIDVLLELTHIQTHANKGQRIAAGNGDVLVLQVLNAGTPMSGHSINLGHTEVWQLERHYKIGDTIAAKVVK